MPSDLEPTLAVPGASTSDAAGVTSYLVLVHQENCSAHLGGQGWASPVPYTRNKGELYAGVKPRAARPCSRRAGVPVPGSRGDAVWFTSPPRDLLAAA